MKVSELADRSGLSAKTIRFYESEGVLPAPSRRRNGYREYDELDVCRVRLVAAFRQLGLGLEESGALAEMCARGRCDEMSTALAARVADRRREVAVARAELEHLDAELASLERGLATGESHPRYCIGKEEHRAQLRLPVRP